MSRSSPVALNSKTKQLIAYLIDKHAVATVTSLMKLCYLSDLVNYQETKKQISIFKYIRWNYGPYDAKISMYLYGLIEDETIKSEVAFTNDGNEYYRYQLANKDYDKSLLSAGELSNVDAVLNSLVGFGPSALIEVAYKTKPMKALQATIGGTEHLGTALNFNQ